MYNGIMDPELMRIAQEQISRIPPDELLRMQQQMLANPELMKMASEGMKNMRPEDMRFAAEQMKNVRKEDLAEIRERMSKASPEEFTAMRAQADAQCAYVLSGAEKLKNQGNQLHSLGKYSEAAEKYLRAKSNLTGMGDSKAKSLILACSLNLMSCYLNAKQYEDCIQAGSEILTYDPKNVKALYRRGQAYKKIGKLELAVADLSKAVEVSPDDETIAEALSDAITDLREVEEIQYNRFGPTIEEITEEEVVQQTVKDEIDVSQSEPPESSVTKDDNRCGKVLKDKDLLSGNQFDANNARIVDSYPESIRTLTENPDMIRTMQQLMTNASPESLAAFSGGKMTPEMVKTASEMFSRMSPDELQNMIKMISTFHPQNEASTSTSNDVNGRSSMPGSQSSPQENGIFEAKENKNSNLFPSLNSSAAFTGLPKQSTELQDQVRNQMKDPVMKQAFTSMMRNMSPEMMANMGEQLGIKLSHEDAIKAQTAMASLSPDDLDRLMNWAATLQRVIDFVRKTKNWILGKPGLIFAFVMLILAIILHRLGYIGQ